MLKLGVTNPARLDDEHTLFGLRRHLAYTMLPRWEASDSQDVEVFERVMKSLRLSSGVYRTTYRGRFADLDREVGRHLRDHFDRTAPLQVSDWAASDGLTSLEWRAAILRDFPLARITSSDRFLYLVEARRGASSYVLEPDGTLLQYVRRPFVIPVRHREAGAYPLNFALRLLAIERSRGLAEIVRSLSWEGSSDRRVHERAGFHLSTIPLIHPEVRAASTLRVEFHDAFEALAEPCQVIRTMNIYNRSYFDPARLRQGINAVMDSLAEGGIWIVGRTNGSEGNATHDAAIFVKRGGSVRRLSRLGIGTEIEDLIPGASGA